MERKTLFIILLMVTSLAAPALGAGAAGDLERVLGSLRSAASGVESLTADFVQEKHLEMFQEVLESKGRFSYVRPDLLRWELTEPVPSGFVLKGDRGRRWHDRTGRSETFRLEREPGMKLIAEQLFAWARVDIEWLRDRFTIAVLQEKPVTLRLVPRAEGAGDYLDHLRIEFAEDGRYVRVVEIFEEGGDFTRIVFQDTRVNGDVDEELF